jgi:hypothetical protein
MREFLWGMLFMASAIAAMMFVRFYRDSRDRLFLFFAAAFVAFALNWLALAVTDPRHEGSYAVYLLRLLGFAVLIVGIVDKNRR